jgi:hypothetical protein
MRDDPGGEEASAGQGGGSGIPRPEDVAGVITKEHVADSVAESIRIYPE